MNTIQLSETVGAMVAEDHYKSEVAKSSGIDFRSSSDKSLNEAGLDAGIIAEKIMAALKQITLGKTTLSGEFNDWGLDSLIDYTINTYHKYAKENIIIIYNLVQEVANHHNEKHPELVKLTTVIFFFFHDLLNQMKKEEQILFPNIQELIKKKSYPERGIYTTFGLIKDLVKMIQKEQHGTAEYLKQFHEITNEYMLPEDACSSYKYLFEKMKEFEADLLQHIYLENNILFPKALAEDEELNEFRVVNLK